jgi:microcystin degradation protein MlrC
MSETKSKSATGKSAKVDLSATLAFVEGDVRRLEEAVGVFELRAQAAEELAQRCVQEMRELRAEFNQRDAEMRALVDKLSAPPKPEDGKARAKPKAERPKKGKKEKTHL